MPISAYRVQALFNEVTNSNRKSLQTVQGFSQDFLIDTTGHEEEIGQMLQELPEKFHEKTGDGWSFLNAFEDKDGNIWTGFHFVVEQLLVMGIATGRVSWLFPDTMWPYLPGHAPYFVVYAQKVELQPIGPGVAA
jgi:hypothetical protein